MNMTSRTPHATCLHASTQSDNMRLGWLPVSDHVIAMDAMLKKVVHCTIQSLICHSLL